ncbi:Ribosomal-protein-alanine acetyltransferase [Pseudovibrio sp. FO-BEG1]|uniref:Ribosomal-protein-alanine N-acetyltransferase n=1 Tax=Pseudovibrio denitrificans TaxID=258256 RepID=A0A1I7AYJ9_9HYPH|nr:MULTISPECIES: ribosomal protein S18-alanine N-acetyltransferase [Pseudovibrio]AEV35007.1 Ribosomal-protein-alanine acetyltransferase [Pseudovibrio sp. FO-BEG1]SFT79982.1 ribosomal-protein-alanine N-acetyltransferase [Pseudovibrio denitrificans]
MKSWWTSEKPPVIERAEKDDLPKLAKLHAECFKQNWGTAELTTIFEQKGVFFLSARTSGVTGKTDLGFVVIRSIAGEAEVLTIAVSPKQQNKGIGRKLMEAAIFQLYSDRTEALFLEVDDTNDSALKLYKKLGFKQVGERKAYYAASEGSGTALVMRCDLL